MFGKLIHYAADAILISAVLAGIKRSTVSSQLMTMLTKPRMGRKMKQI
jgi:hypothetical protein